MKHLLGEKELGSEFGPSHALSPSSSEAFWTPQDPNQDFCWVLGFSAIHKGLVFPTQLPPLGKGC